MTIEFLKFGANEPEAEVQLVVNGKKFRNWSGLNFKTELDACASGFSFDVPYNPDSERIFKLFGYETVKILYRGRELSQGVAEVVSYGSAANNRSVNIQCRSRAGRLLDDNMEPPYQFQNMTFQQIAEQVSGGLAKTTTDTGRIPIASAESDQSKYEFLTKIAAPKGLWARPALDGTVEFISLKPDEKADLKIRPNTGPIASIKFAADGTGRYSKYVATGSNYGALRNNSVNDPDIPESKRGAKYVKPEQQSTDMLGAAKREMRSAMIDSFSCSFDADGWEFDGTLWLAGLMVEIEWPDVGIDVPTKFRVSQADLKYDSGSGKTASIGLSLPEAYETD